MNRAAGAACSEPGSRRVTSASSFSRYRPAPASTRLSRRWSNHAGWVKSPVPSTAMPLRRAHQARFGRVRSRLQAREYLEWMCKSATYVSAATEDPSLTEGTLHPVTTAGRATSRHARSDITDTRLNPAEIRAVAQQNYEDSLLRGTQFDESDLWRGADPDRRPPEPGAV